MADISDSNWNEADASNTAAAPDGAPEGMAPSGVNDVLRAHQGAVKRFWNKINAVKTTGGTTTAYTLTYDVAPAAYVDGEIIAFVINATCGASPTINVNALGAKALRKWTGLAWAAVAAGDLLIDQVVQARYNSTAGTFDIIGTGVVPTATTWTPTDASGAGLTFSSASGTYQKIGNWVFASFRITFPSTANGASVTIGGLPVTSANSVLSAGPHIMGVVGGAGGSLRVVQNATTFIIFNPSGTQLVNSDVSTLTIFGTIFYPASV